MMIRAFRDAQRRQSLMILHMPFRECRLLCCRWKLIAVRPIKRRIFSPKRSWRANKELIGEWGVGGFDVVFQWTKPESRMKIYGSAAAQTQDIPKKGLTGEWGSGDFDWVFQSNKQSELEEGIFKFCFGIRNWWYRYLRNISVVRPLKRRTFPRKRLTGEWGGGDWNESGRSLHALLGIQQEILRHDVGVCCSLIVLGQSESDIVCLWRPHGGNEGQTEGRLPWDHHTAKSHRFPWSHWTPMFHQPSWDHHIAKFHQDPFRLDHPIPWVHGRGKGFPIVKSIGKDHPQRMSSSPQWQRNGW